MCVCVCMYVGRRLMARDGGELYVCMYVCMYADEIHGQR